MGLFDFFKKKDQQQPGEQEIPKNELFILISSYNEYIVRFIHMQQEGNYAPISAYEKPNGEIIGFLYLDGDNSSYSLTAEEAVNRMETKFEQELADNKIISYAILYHSQFNNDNNHTPSDTDNNTLKAISVSYNFKNSEKGKIGLPYIFENNEISYRGFTNFTQEENAAIFSTRLKEDKDYFQDLEEIKFPVIENSIGLKITKSNSKDVSNIWAGIFGFHTYRTPNGSAPLKEHFALAMSNQPVYVKDDLKISQLEFNDVTFKAVVVNEKPKTILPVIKTNNVVDVENKEIIEWENIDNLEAIITATGKDTFGVTYFATDYAENRELYLSQKKHPVKISGIAFVLDTYKKNNTESTINFSDDFTGYTPSRDLPDYACFDFIGQLEDIKETQLLQSGSLKGYIMKIRLITHPEVNDLFTIDIYVTPENMRCKELTKGMKLTGMFQMQGQIVK